MKHSDFQIGTVFFTAGGKWCCTDVGTRTIAAINIGKVTAVTSSAGGENRTTRILNEEQAKKEGWFDGPPYAVAERLFDESDIEGCELNAEDL